MDFTKIYHRTAYAKINPALPENDQSGRTVLITGASEGIGLGIAQGFAAARAKRVILVARSQNKLDASLTELRKVAPPGTECITVVCDCSDVSQIESLWTKLAQDGHYVDVLILNAGPTGGTASAAEAAAFFHFGVICKLHFLELFQNQKVVASTNDPSSTATRQKILIEVTSGSVHCYGGYPRAAYPATKAGFGSYLCHAAEQIPESELRLVCFHPGAVYTSAAAKASTTLTADSPMWDDISLPSQAAVWLAGKEADFLHGRVMWANWDVVEMLERRSQISSDPSALKIGIIGVPNFSVRDLGKLASGPSWREQQKK